MSHTKDVQHTPSDPALEMSFLLTGPEYLYDTVLGCVMLLISMAMSCASMSHHFQRAQDTLGVELVVLVEVARGLVEPAEG